MPSSEYPLVPAGKVLPEPDHGVSIELAIIVELLPDGIAPLFPDLCIDRLEIGDLRHPAVLYALELVVVEIRRDSRNTALMLQLPSIAGW